MESTRGTVAELVHARWGDHRPGLWCGERTLTHHEVAGGAAARAALLTDLLPPGAHLGILLDNTPEYPLWLSAAALARAAVAGINPTRRGPELARDILHTECRLLITDRTHLPLLDGLELSAVRLLVTDTEEYDALLAPYAGCPPRLLPRHPRRPAPPLLHLGFDRRPQGRDLHPGQAGRRFYRTLAYQFAVRPDDVHYVCMPMFHGNAVIADWAPALVSRRGRGPAAPLLRVGLPDGRKAPPGDVLHLRGPGDPVCPGHRARPGRPGPPAEARVRHRGGGGGRGGVRAAVRGAAGGGIRVVGGRRGDPVAARHPVGRGRTGDPRPGRAAPRDARGVPMRPSSTRRAGCSTATRR